MKHNKAPKKSNKILHDNNSEMDINQPGTSGINSTLSTPNIATFKPITIIPNSTTFRPVRQTSGRKI